MKYFIISLLLAMWVDLKQTYTDPTNNKHIACRDLGICVYTPDD